MKRVRADVDDVLRGNKDVLLQIRNRKAMRDLKIDEILEKRRFGNIKDLVGK